MASNLLDIAIEAHAPSIRPRPKKAKTELRPEHTYMNDDVCVCASGMGKIAERLRGKLDELEAFLGRETITGSNRDFCTTRRAKCESLVSNLRVVLEASVAELADVVEMSVREGAAQLKKANADG